MKKVELTERQAVGLAGAIRLLEAGGWPPEKILPFVRAISTRSDITTMSKLDIVEVTFWFMHRREDSYTINVTVQQISLINRFRWKLVFAEGYPIWTFHCLFDENGQAYGVEGEAPFLKLVNS
ncbi:MAG: hypothetical protein MUP45_02185 [Candidatus Marinimicrobia bacterium]|nr:hypothetical protein [Candidatus Neomarinimicrobiota bacterium]